MALALVLTIVNWWAGSKWLIGLSRLDAVRDEAESRAQGSFEAREIYALLEVGGHGTGDRSYLEWIISICRRLADHPLPINDTPDPPPGTGHGFGGDPEGPVESPTDLQRALISFNYLAVRHSFPEGDLPADPWFVMGGEHWPSRNSSPSRRRFQVRSHRRPPWSEISQ